MSQFEPQTGAAELSAALALAKQALIAIAFVSVFLNMLMLTGPLFMMQVYDRVLSSGSLQTLAALGGIVLGLYLFYGLLEALRGRMLMRTGLAMEARLTSQAFQSLVALPLRMGRAGHRLDPLRELETIRQFLSGGGPSAFMDLPWMPLYLAVLFVFHPWLGFAATAAAVVMFLLIVANELVMRAPLAEASSEAAKRNSISDAARSNAEAMTALGMVSGLNANWQECQDKVTKLQGKAGDWGAFFGSLIKTFRFVLQSGMLALGAYLAIDGAISHGVMIAASIVTSRALAPIEQAVGQWKGFLAARRGIKRLRELLAAIEFVNPETELPLPQENLSVETLLVAAPGSQAPIVKGVSIDLKRGDALGIIGNSGSGKSTLGRALVGVWEPFKGCVRLDGAELHQWKQERLGKAIGYLPQEVQLFAGTVAENIARFDPGRNSEAIIAAAKSANIHQMILSLPKGYETDIGEGGAVLSGGQRQRIALARALYGNPFLVVLDEPNSNLDADGDAALTRALRDLKQQGAIVIVIAHRQSAIAVVDHLLVLNGGVPEALGPKDQVLAQVIQGQDAAKANMSVVGAA